MKLTLKAPGSKRLKLRYDELLSNVAFKLNLRRYIMAHDSDDFNKWEAGQALTRALLLHLVGRCRLTL
jgi:hypothetical protein